MLRVEAEYLGTYQKLTLRLGLDRESRIYGLFRTTNIECALGSMSVCGTLFRLDTLPTSI